VVGKGEVYDTPEEQDQVEASALYDMLEREVVPLFYDRSGEGVPRGWVEMMKASLATFIPRFNANRMAADYLQRFYLPAAALSRELVGGRYRGARELGRFRRKVARHWEKVRFEDIVGKTGHEPRVGDRVEVEVILRLGDLAPEEVAVEAICGPLDPQGRFRERSVVPLRFVGAAGPGRCTFGGEFPVQVTGSYGVKARVTPSHPLLNDRTGWGFFR
jgi:starch phosphorylase